MKFHKFTVALAVIATAIAFSTTAVAQTVDDSEGGTFSVSISKELQLDVSPNSMSYSQVDPGSANYTSDSGYSGIEIENIGSQNITNMWVGASAPIPGASANNLNRTFGGTAAAFDAGNFIQVRPTGELTGTLNPDDAGSSATGAGFHYVNRVDFNASNELSYITTQGTEGLAGAADMERYGRFRAGNESFFWMINASSTSSAEQECSGADDGALYVGDSQHSRSNLGSVDFTDSSTTTKYTIQTGPSFGSGSYGKVSNVNIPTSKGQKTYTVLTYCGADTGTSTSTGLTNKTFVIRTRYNIAPLDSAEMATSLGTLEKLVNNTGSTTNEVQPGEHFTLETAVSVPLGVSTGNATDGTLTVYANNQ